MTHIEYNRAASDRMARAIMLEAATSKAVAANESRFTETAKWAGYVFAFFCVTCAAILAVAGAL